ncbi:hypothetical protein HS088_TW15G01054 [Tripterygium wilfordii]|uniref:Uncharacterized protein n=1 Tax=Tripterygium wilfordii TaxID=458696 RepID=A0A7J7CN86_TRIWF|nr:hypothetical protein HS088_TW15G01054 [Tripterygium wilfordii]
MESKNDALQSDQKTEKPQKHPFRCAQDDTKPPLHDPVTQNSLILFEGRRVGGEGTDKEEQLKSAAMEVDNW